MNKRQEKKYFNKLGAKVGQGVIIGNIRCRHNYPTGTIVEDISESKLGNGFLSCTSVNNRLYQIIREHDIKIRKR